MRRQESETARPLRPPHETSRRGTVGAVVVSHEPDPMTLRRTIGAVASQVERVIVVDNGSAEDALAAVTDDIPANVSLQRLPANRGVAAAQNIGIAHARETGVEFVLLLDQDSVCEPDMVARLVAAVRNQEERGVDVSAVGPQYRLGAEERLSGFVRFGSLGLKRRYCPPDGEEAVEADFLISSGALLPMTAVDRVGNMEEGLFIDHVDTEWFLRARGRGFRCFGVCGAVMRHELGEGTGRLWVGRWRHVPHHRPFRYYYIVRNSLLLYRRSYAPARWIIGDLMRLCGIGLFNLAVRGDRTERLRMMARGLRDGLAGRDGPSGAHA